MSRKREEFCKGLLIIILCRSRRTAPARGAASVGFWVLRKGVSCVRRDERWVGALRTAVEHSSICPFVLTLACLLDSSRGFGSDHPRRQRCSVLSIVSHECGDDFFPPRPPPPTHTSMAVCLLCLSSRHFYSRSLRPTWYSIGYAVFNCNLGVEKLKIVFHICRGYELARLDAQLMFVAGVSSTNLRTLD